MTAPKEWICDSCNFANTTKQNDYKCNNCTALHTFIVDVQEAKLFDNNDYNAFIDEADENNNWGDAEPIDVFAGHNMDKNEKNTLKYEKLPDAWTCQQCKYQNNRISAIKNEFKCIECKFDLKVTEEHKYSLETNVDKVAIQANNDISELTLSMNDQTIYRPSLFNGIYGSYCYKRTFSSFKVQVNCTKVNITNIKKIPVECKISEFDTSNEYFININNNKIFIDEDLHLLLLLSTKKYTEFGQDLFPLFYDHFNRFILISEIKNKIQNDILFAQLYWIDDTKTVNKIVFMTQNLSLLTDEYDKISNKFAKVLAINNSIEYKNDKNRCYDLFEEIANDYKSDEFKFISSNLFYHSFLQQVVKKNDQLQLKELKFISNAFKTC
eukprot:134434_1